MGRVQLGFGPMKLLQQQPNEPLQPHRLDLQAAFLRRARGKYS